MTEKSFADTIRERIAAVEVVTEAIAGEGSETDLRDLRVLLINTMSLLSRDPGVAKRPPTFECAQPSEVRWLVEWIEAGHTSTRPLPYVCDAWVERDGDLTYQWVITR